MNMLNRMGLTLNWITLDRFLNDQMEKRLLQFRKNLPSSTPLLFLLDNINMYRGSKKYMRLFRKYGPKMWNFTGRGIIIPDSEQIKYHFFGYRLYYAATEGCPVTHRR